MKMRVWLVGLVALFGWCISGCSQKHAKELTIGAILPLSGDAAEYGTNDKNGIELAVEEINMAGGIGGQQLKVLYEDCQADAKSAVAAISKLGLQGVAAVIDDAISSIALALVPVAQANKQAIISTGASNPSLSGMSPYFFRIWNSDAEEGVIAAKFALHETGKGGVAILFVNNDYGVGLSKVFSDELIKNGGAVVGKESFEKDARDFRGQITKLKGAKPKAVYLVGYASQTGIAAQQLLEQGVSVRIIGTVAMEDPQFVKLAGQASESVVYPFPEQSTGAAATQFRQAFQKKYGKEPGLLCDCGYDAAKLFILALQQGARTGDEIKEKLRLVKDYQGASGLITFDDKGDVHKPMIMKVIRGGKFVAFADKPGAK